jgi:hypothetical protein
MRKDGVGTYHEGNTEENNNVDVVFISRNIHGSVGKKGYTLLDRYLKTTLTVIPNLGYLLHGAKIPFQIVTGGREP